MSNFTACIDYNRIKQSSDVVATSYKELNKSDVISIFNEMNSELSKVSSLHDNCFYSATKLTNQLVESFETTRKSINNLDNALVTTLDAYDEAEEYIDGKTENLGSLLTRIATAYGATSLSNSIDDIKSLVWATSVDDFVKNMDGQVKDYMSTIVLDEDTFPSNYEDAASWKEALIKKYKDAGYSDEEGKKQAEKDMIVWRMSQTGGTLASSAISTYPDYQDLIDKYKTDFNLTEKQAESIAQAEIDYKEAKQLVEASPNDLTNKNLIEKTNALNELKEKYGIEELTPEEIQNATEEIVTPSSEELPAVEQPIVEEQPAVQSVEQQPVQSEQVIEQQQPVENPVEQQPEQPTTSTTETITETPKQDNNVIKIEKPKETPSAETNTSSKTDSSATAIGLGLGVAGAVIAGGAAAKVIHDKKNNNELTAEEFEMTETNGAFEEPKGTSNIKDAALPEEKVENYTHQEDSLYDETQDKEDPFVAEKYHAGTVNRIPIEGGYDTEYEVEEKYDENEELDD